jgi:gluconolactonase
MSKFIRCSTLALISITFCSTAFGQATMRGDGPAPEAAEFRIVKADPALEGLIAADAELELMADGFGLNEGPVWVRDGGPGYLLASGLLDNVIYKITPEKEVSVFMEYSGYSGDSPDKVGMQTRSGRQHVLLIGSGCASLDAQNRLVWCAKNDGAVMRLEPDGTRTLMADNHQGKRFSGPNDLTIKSNGSIYFTDTDSGLRDGNLNPLKQLDNGAWLIKDGQTTRLLKRTEFGGSPNGIALSADEKYLYLAVHHVMKRYEIKADDTLGKGMVFSEGEGIGDGMKVDTLGNVWSTGGAGPGMVSIISPQGKLLGMLHLPIYGKEPKKQICATNLAFGGADGKSLYITACDAIYRIGLNVAGILPGSAR